MIDQQEIVSVLELLESCTFDQQLVIIMRYLNDLTIADTAEVLNWSEGKVKTTQHRALKHLRIQADKNKVGRG